MRRTKRGSRKTYVFTYPSRKAMQAVRDRTRACAQSRSTLYRDLDEILLTLGRSLRGWANYFRHGSSSRHFQQIDYYAWKRIGAWIRRKHHPISWREVRRRYTRDGRYAYNGITFQGASSVKIERYRHRGSKIPNPWTITPRPRRDQRARHTESRMRGQLARTVRAGGQRKRTESNPGTAPLADPTVQGDLQGGIHRKTAPHGSAGNRG